MDWATLFLKPEGRIGRGAFWLGLAALAALQGLACLVPRAGWFAFMILAYGWVCLFAKRLHDIGRSGWLTVTPLLVSLIGLSAAAAFWMQTFAARSSPLLLYWVSGAALAVASAVDLAFLAWVGLCSGEAEENSYGPALTRAAPVED